MNSSPQAFTLLEMVLAVALAAMLMVLVLAVSANVRRTQSKLDRDPQDTTAEMRLVGLIERDLAEASEIEASADGFSLTGTGRLDDGRLGNRHGSTRTTYRIADVSGQRCLLREQTEIESLTNQNSQLELLGSGIDRLDLGLPPQAQSGSIARNELESCWIAVQWTDSSRPLLRKWIALK